MHSIETVNVNYKELKELLDYIQDVIETDGYYAVEEKIDAFLTKIELEDINNDCNASWLQMAGSEITYLKNHLKRVIT